MKRLALVLAAAVLGTGCYVAPCDGTVTLDWRGGFTDADNVPLATCVAAGVQTIDVWVNGGLAASFPCTDGVGTVAVPESATSFDVEALDGSTIVFRDRFSVNGTCGNQGVVTAPGEGWLEVDYSFFPVNACATPPTYMWLEVWDDVAGQIAFLENGTTAAQQCSTTAAAPRYRLPAGAFTFDGIEEVRLGTGVLAADCTARGFPVGAGAVTTVSPVLLDSGAACF